MLPYGAGKLCKPKSSYMGSRTDEPTNPNESKRFGPVTLDASQKSPYFLALNLALQQDLRRSRRPYACEVRILSS
jgi:hypothetical protein